MKLKKYVGIFLASLMIMTTSVALAADENVNLGTIDVAGTSQVEVAPNKGVVRLSIENTNKDAKVAAAENAAIMQNIQGKLLGLAIPKDKLQTINYNVYPEYNNHKIVGYKVNNTIAVTVDDITKLGTVVDTALAAGANNIESINLGINNEGQYRDQVLTAAIANAKAQAEIAAAALGKKVVGVKHLNVYNTSVGNSVRTLSYSMKAAVAMDSAPTPVQEGTLQLKANVNATFYIQ